MELNENKIKNNNDPIDTFSLKWKYLTYLFNKKDFKIYDTIKSFKVDSVSLYSITPHYYAEKITRIISKYYSNLDKLTISDFCCCIGGNSFNFIKYFKHVNCVELDKKRFDFLRHNMSLYRKHNNFNNYKLLNLNCFDVYDKIDHDIIFIDPPWNGKDYKKNDSIDLYLDNINASDFCNIFIKTCKMIVLKIPNNFNLNNFKHKYDIYDLNIFKLIIIQK